MERWVLERMGLGGLCRAVDEEGGGGTKEATQPPSHMQCTPPYAQDEERYAHTHHPPNVPERVRKEEGSQLATRGRKSGGS